MSKVRRVELLDESTPDDDEDSAKPTETIPEITSSTTELAAKEDPTTTAPADKKINSETDDEENIDRGSPEVYAPENENEIDNGFQVPDRRNLKIVQQI